MARKISSNFLKEIKELTKKPILEYVKYDDTLDMELRGNSVIIYYRGGKLLTIEENSNVLVGIDEKYYKEGSTQILPTIQNIEDYIPQAKHIIDRYVVEKRNHLWEKEIQQRIVQENNYSQNSFDTDFFIIDVEYQDIGRADIVALRWDSTPTAHGLSKNYCPKITLFEIKQGFNTLRGGSGMYPHWKNFNSFISTSDINNFKQDMIAVFEQKRKLGLIVDMEKCRQINKVADDIDFIFLLANYKPSSESLANELALLPDNCEFIYANPMGYGLYAKNIVDKQKFIAHFL